MQFSKRLLGLIVAVSSVLAVAQDDRIKLENWMGNSQRIINDADMSSKPAWLRTEPSPEALQAAQKLKERADVVRQKIADGQTPAQIVSDDKTHWSKAKDAASTSSNIELTITEYSGKTESYIFVSQSMSNAEIKAAMEVSSETGATLIFRGIKPGQAIDHVGMILGKIMQQNPDLTPSAIIEPTLFEEYQVESVPTSVVVMDGVTIKATGTISIDYLLEKLNDNKSGDLGVVGPVKPVVEPDMIEEMKRRAGLIDWEKQTDGAADRFWTQSWPQFNFPVSETNESYLVDPTFVLNQDIVAGGRVLASKGARYNPQKMLPLSQIIVFFDATDKKQINAVKQFIAKSKEPIEKFVLIITQMDRQNGFREYERLNELMGKDIKVMEKGISDRFRIKSIPSVVTGSGEHYKVQQIAIGKKG